jgi:hypothetical protein
MFKVSFCGRIVVTFGDVLPVPYVCHSNNMNDCEYQVPVVETQLPLKVIQFVTKVDTQLSLKVIQFVTMVDTQLPLKVIQFVK